MDADPPPPPDAARAPVIRHASQVPPTSWDDPVRGRLRFRPLFDRTMTPSGALTAGLAELEVGDWLGIHQHPEPEMYHVVEGTGVLHLEGAEHDLGVGSSVFIPGGADHGIRQTGGGLLRVYYTFPVGSLEDVHYRWP